MLMTLKVAYRPRCKGIALTAGKFPFVCEFFVIGCTKTQLTKESFQSTDLLVNGCALVTFNTVRMVRVRVVVRVVVRVLGLRD